MSTHELSARGKRHLRIRMKVSGDAARPRMLIRRSLSHLSAQLIDDQQKKTLFSLATYDKAVKPQFAQTGNLKAAVAFGQLFAQKAKEKGFLKVVFDRAGYQYHGRVKAFADAARKGGLEF